MLGGYLSLVLLVMQCWLATAVRKVRSPHLDEEVLVTQALQLFAVFRQCSRGGVRPPAAVLDALHDAAILGDVSCWHHCCGTARLVNSVSEAPTFSSAALSVWPCLLVLVLGLSFFLSFLNLVLSFSLVESCSSPVLPLPMAAAPSLPFSIALKASSLAMPFQCSC